MANKTGGKTCLRHTQFNNVNSVYLFIKEKTKATYLLVMIKIEIELIKRSDSFQKKKSFKNLIVHFKTTVFTLKQNSFDP